MHPHPAMGLEGMLNVLTHPVLCLAVVYKAKFLPKTRAVNLMYFEGIIPSRQTLPGQGSGFVDVEPVHECRNVLVGGGKHLATQANSHRTLQDSAVFSGSSGSGGLRAGVCLVWRV